MNLEQRNTPENWRESLEFAIYKDLIPCITEKGKLYSAAELMELIQKVTGKEDI